MAKCELCSICKNDSYRVVSENNSCFACVNIEPLLNSHLMIIPKRHVTKLGQLTKEEAKEMFSLLGKISEILKNKFKTKGTLTMINDHELRSQEHIHFHIIASNHNLRDFVSNLLKTPYRKRLEKTEIENIAKSIIK